jgi:multiple antibiotic resistance protein
MILLFLVLDPLGNIPVFLSVLHQFDSKRKRKIIFRELCIALGVLLGFLFAGKYILSFLQIDEPTLSIAGGIILFMIAIKMIFPISKWNFDEEPKAEDPVIVPLAIPLIAGPSALTTILLLVTQEPSRWFDWFIALIAAWAISAVILLSSSWLGKIFGEKGLIALERLMGMLLTTIAVQMFLTGIRQFMNQ